MAKKITPNYDYIFSRVKKMELTDYRIFKINSTYFNLILVNSANSSEIDYLAFYSRSTLIDGFDIYLNINQPVEDRLRCLFHEIVEILFRVQYRNTKTTTEAHELTIPIEEKYFGKRKVL